MLNAAPSLNYNGKSTHIKVHSVTCLNHKKSLTSLNIFVSCTLPALQRIIDCVTVTWWEREFLPPPQHPQKLKVCIITSIIILIVILGNVTLMGLTYLVTYACMAGDSYCRRFTSLLLCLLSSIWCLPSTVITLLCWRYHNHNCLMIITYLTVVACIADAGACAVDAEVKISGAHCITVVASQTLLTVGLRRHAWKYRWSWKAACRWVLDLSTCDVWRTG